MEDVALTEIFDVSYGNKFDLNKMEAVSGGENVVAFVGRSSQNNGVSAFVRPRPNVEPFEAGNLTVALGGSKVLSSFVQMHAFYTAQNVSVLKPKKALGFNQKVYYCVCIRHNRFRYSAFGREANRTIGDLRVPETIDIPDWVNSTEEQDISGIAQPSDEGAALPPVSEWKHFRLEDLFEFEKGRRLTRSDMTQGIVPFVGASDSNNGITAFVGQEPRHSGGTITVSYNGSVGEAFYQPVPYFASDDINVLKPKFEMAAGTALFLCTLIRKEKYRYSYGRKWHLERMRTSTVRVPVDSLGEPDWKLVSKYMHGLRFGKAASAWTHSLGDSHISN